MDARTAEKRQTLLQYLARGVTMVHLDARRPGVTVPQQYRTEAHLRLNLSYRYAIPDFEIGERHVQSTLSFGGKPFQCILPWESIFAITSHVDGDGQVWPEDLPTEVVQTLAARKQRGRRAAKSAASAAESPRPPLAAVAPASDDEKGAERAEEKLAEERQREEQEPPRRHLRLVR